MLLITLSQERILKGKKLLQAKKLNQSMMAMFRTSTIVII